MCVYYVSFLYLLRVYFNKIVVVFFFLQVYIVGHIPPGSDERQVGSQQNGHTTFSEKNNLRYLRLVRKYSNVILGQFFGHLHSDSFRIIYNEIGKVIYNHIVVVVYTIVVVVVVVCVDECDSDTHTEMLNGSYVMLPIIDMCVGCLVMSTQEQGES